MWSDMRTLLSTTLFFSLLAFGQEKEKQPNTSPGRQQKLEAAKEASRKWVESIKRLDAMFPDQPPVAHIAEAEVEKTIKEAEEIEKLLAESEKQLEEGKKSLADLQAKMAKFEEEKRSACKDRKTELESGKIPTQIRDIWVGLVEECNRRYPPKK